MRNNSGVGESIGHDLDPDRTTTQRTPADLLARTALSDQQAFAELYRLTRRIYSVCCVYCRSSAEVLQSYVNIWHHAGSVAAEPTLTG